jgi:hypothetical protein
MDILPQAFKKGARRNVTQRANGEIASFFPVTERTELSDRKVTTQLTKMSYMPKDLSMGYLCNQYEALQMIPVPGKKAKKTVQVERLNPSWMQERLCDKFLALVRTAPKKRTATKGKLIHIPMGEARVKARAPTYILSDVRLHYPQNHHETCLFTSVACAMHYLHKKNLASTLSLIATKCMSKYQ